MRKARRKSAQPRRRFADPRWIESRHLCRSQEVGRAAICARVGAVSDVAIAKAIQWDDAILNGGADDAIVVEIEKEKQLVTLDRSADRPAKLVLDQVIPRNDGSRVVAEPAVRHQRGIAVILVQIAMKMIGAALGHQGELSAAGRSGRR